MLTAVELPVCLRVGERQNLNPDINKESNVQFCWFCLLEAVKMWDSWEYKHEQASLCTVHKEASLQID